MTLPFSQSRPALRPNPRRAVRFQTSAVLTALILLGFLILQTGCAGKKPSTKGKLLIGFSMDSLQLERWHRDRDVFVKRAQELGAEVLVQSADGNDALQVRQAENLLTQGVEVLVVIPHNGEIASSIVDDAKRQGVPVIAYDRIIRNSDVDFYVSFDNVKVGEQQAEYLVQRAPKGNYVLIGGSPTDDNARQLREGQMKVLKPAIDRGDIKIVGDQWAKDWLPSEALRHAENALTQARNNVVAVVASNDSTAGGVVQALEEQKLAGKVLVSGQDAELAACQRIVAGTQSMTVYKPVVPLATRAAEIAVAMARHEPSQPNAIMNNGSKNVPSFLLDAIVVDKSNISSIVMRDKFVSWTDVYKYVPRDQWPKIESK
jgi:D-xylose transport system substrate-binding protein